MRGYAICGSWIFWTGKRERERIFNRIPSRSPPGKLPLLTTTDTTGIHCVVNEILQVLITNNDWEYTRRTFQQQSFLSIEHYAWPHLLYPSVPYVTKPAAMPQCHVQYRVSSLWGQLSEVSMLHDFRNSLDHMIWKSVEYDALWQVQRCLKKNNISSLLGCNPL